MCFSRNGNLHFFKPGFGIWHGQEAEMGLKRSGNFDIRQLIGYPVHCCCDVVKALDIFNDFHYFIPFLYFYGLCTCALTIIYMWKGL